MMNKASHLIGCSEKCKDLPEYTKSYFFINVVLNTEYFCIRYAPLL